MDGNNQMDNNQTYINNENNLLVFMTKLGDRSEKKKTIPLQAFRGCAAGPMSTLYDGCLRPFYQ